MYVPVSGQGLIVPDSGKLVLPEYMKPQPGNYLPVDSPGYKSTVLRYPKKQPLVLLPHRFTDVTGLPRDADGGVGRERTCSGSTSACRAPTKRSSSTCSLRS